MNWMAAFFVIAGGFFSLVAAIGVLRMPDLYTRMHAATKAGAFGAALVLVGAALHFGSLRTVVVAAATIVFFYLTAPVAAQVLARAAYRRQLPTWGDGRIDEIREPRDFVEESRGPKPEPGEE